MNQRMYQQVYQNQDNNQFVNQQYQKPPTNPNFQNDQYSQEQSGLRQSNNNNNMQNSYDQEPNNIQQPYNQNYGGGAMNSHADQNQHINGMYAQFHQSNENQNNPFQQQQQQQKQQQLQQQQQSAQGMNQNHLGYENQNNNVYHSNSNRFNDEQQHQDQSNTRYVQEQLIVQQQQQFLEQQHNLQQQNSQNEMNNNGQQQEHNQIPYKNEVHTHNYNQGAQFMNQLDDAEMELPEEQSMEERQSNDNISRYINRHNEAGVGFLRKLNTSAYGKKSVIRSKIDLLFDTLDEKAQLQNQFKTLAQYERKLDIQPNQTYDAKPVILIKWNETQQMFELNEEILNVFQKNRERRNSKVSFVSIAGEKGSGKTFLLNTLLQNNVNAEKFQNSYHGNSIIMWSEPIYDKSTDCEIYFLDYEMSEQLKEKMFFIQCIISNALIYNVQSNSIKSNDFHYLRHLLKMQNYFEFDSLEFKEDLKYLMPKLQFVMRDFTHEIKKQGYTMSGQQYLEEYLFDELQFSKATPQEQKLRRRFIKYFSDRDLFTMVCPVNPSDIDGQRKLQNLNGIAHEELDPVFQGEVSSLRKKIISKNEVRSIHGIRFSKNMFIQYIQSFLEDANSNEKFNIEKAISILLENEFITVYHECVDKYKQVMEQHFGECEFMSLEAMNESLRKAREQVYYNFFRLKAHDVEIAEQFFQKYYDLLKQFIRDMEEQFHSINNEETSRIVSELIKEKVKVIQQKTKNDTFKIQDIMFIKEQFEGILNEIKNTCVGKQANYGETYGIFVTQIQRTMMDVIVQQIQNTRTQNKNQLTELKQQTATLQKKLNQIKEDNKNQLKQNENNSKERAQQQEELAKLQKQEDQLKASLKTHQDQLEHIKWQSGRYQQALKEKTC